MDYRLLLPHQKLNEFLSDYYNYLLNNDIIAYDSYAYVYDLIKLFNINWKYINKITFDDNINVYGLFIPESKEIIINTSKLEAAYRLGFINKQKKIILYYKILLHELNHLMQYKYMIEENDEVSKVLKISSKLKEKSENKIHYYHELFPDEIDSNIRTDFVIKSVVTKFIKDNAIGLFISDSLISHLREITFFEGKIINSQFDYLCQKLLGNRINNDSISELNDLCLGIEKNDSLMQAIIDCCQTQDMCFDIKEGRLIYGKTNSLLLS